MSPIATLVAVGLAALTLATPRAAEAAGNAAARAGGSSTQNAPLSRESSWTAAARLGRVRMKQGDCASAVDAFDESLRGSIDVTARRDRGLCHEKLEHPYPAIADYRAYLTEYPDAPDSDGIRQRLAGLEEKVGQGSARDERATAVNNANGAQANATFALRAGNTSLSADGTTAVPPPRGASLDAVQAWESQEVMATSSPLRRGKGFVIGPYLNFRRFTDANLAWGQTVGIGFRYSLSHVSTLLSEVGYSSVNATGTATSRGGLGIFAGYEARFPLNPYVTDAIYLGGGVGYEHLQQQATGQVFATILPRARVGYRHVFGPALGLEAGLDGGYAFFRILDAPAGKDASSGSAVVALNVALVLGF